MRTLRPRAELNAPLASKKRLKNWRGDLCQCDITQGIQHCEHLWLEDAKEARAEGQGRVAAGERSKRSSLILHSTAALDGLPAVLKVGLDLRRLVSTGSNRNA